jgi:hypothetical protein
MVFHLKQGNMCDALSKMNMILNIDNHMIGDTSGQMLYFI